MKKLAQKMHSSERKVCPVTLFCNNFATKHGLSLNWTFQTSIVTE